MTARVEITENTASPALLEALRSMQGEGLRLMLDDIGEYLVRATRERASRQGSPEGVAWAALSPRYQRAKDKKRPGAPTLKFDFHMLGDRLSQQVAGTDLLVGTSAKYGARQHFGGEFEQPGRVADVFFRRERDGTVGNRFVSRRKSNFAQRVTIPAYKITTPARPWLGVSAQDAVEVLLIASDHVSGGVSG